MIDKKVLYLAGAGFIGIATILTVRELQLELGWSITLLLAALCTGVQFTKASPAKTLTIGAFAALGLSGPVGYFLSGREMSFYFATTAYFVGALLLAFRLDPEWRSAPDIEGARGIRFENLQAGAIGFAAIVSSLSFFWLTYFRYLTSLQDEFIARRLIFTLFLLTIGIGLNVAGRARSSTLIGYGGLLYLIAGVAKALAYDTTHLTGFLRIGVFVLGGIVLVCGATLMSTKTGLDTTV